MVSFVTSVSSHLTQLPLHTILLRADEQVLTDLCESNKGFFKVMSHRNVPLKFRLLENLCRLQTDEYLKYCSDCCGMVPFVLIEQSVNSLLYAYFRSR